VGHIDTQQGAKFFHDIAGFFRGFELTQKKVSSFSEKVSSLKDIIDRRVSTIHCGTVYD
jgi:hypothetical protein